MSYHWYVSALLGSLILFAPSISTAKPLAFFTSGGGTMSGNNCRYYENIRKAHVLLDTWQKYNLVADGPRGTGNNGRKCDATGRRNAEPASYTRQEPVGGNDAGANDIEKFVKEKIKDLKPGDPVFLYFTDHGINQQDGKGSRICLWGKEMNVADLRRVLAAIPSENKVVMAHDQCFGGGMLESLFDRDGKLIRSNACGFAAATGKEVAFNGGGFMKHAASMVSEAKFSDDLNGDGYFSFGEAYRHLQKKGAYSIYSSTISSSDLFMQKYLREKKIEADAAGVDFPMYTSLKQIDSYCESASALWSEYSAMLGSMTNALFYKQIEQIKSDLRTQYTDAGFDPEKVTYRDIVRAENKARFEFLAIDKTHGIWKPRLDAMVQDWIEDEHEDLLDEYEDAIDDKEDLEEDAADIMKDLREDKSLTGPEKIELIKKRAALNKKITALITRAQKIKSKIETLKTEARKGKSAEFLTWNRDNGKYENVYQKFKSTNDKWWKAVKEQKRFRMLRTTLDRYNGVRRMVKPGNSKLLYQYMQLLACENTKMADFPK